MLGQTRLYSPKEFTNPFANCEIAGSMLAMRRDAAGGTESGGVQAVFHFYMLALADALAGGSKIAALALGIGQYFRYQVGSRGGAHYPSSPRQMTPIFTNDCSSR